MRSCADGAMPLPLRLAYVTRKYVFSVSVFLPLVCSCSWGPVGLPSISPRPISRPSRASPWARAGHRCRRALRGWVRSAKVCSDRAAARGGADIGIHSNNQGRLGFIHFSRNHLQVGRMIPPPPENRFFFWAAAVALQIDNPLSYFSFTAVHPFSIHEKTLPVASMWLLPKPVFRFTCLCPD